MLRGPLTRGAFVRGSVALAAAGGAWSSIARPARAATIPDGDLTYLRLLIGAELLAADFQSRALAGRKLGAVAATSLKLMQADERAHYAGLAELLTSAGSTPATAGDVDFSYPAGSFASASSIARLAVKIETLTLGAYLGAITDVQTPSVRLPIGQIAANEAQHLSVVSSLDGRPAVGRAFAAALPIHEASNALDAYES